MQVLEAIYTEARECTVVLRRAGLSEDAENLDTALYGATSGEVLSRLGYYLATILKARPTLSKELRVRLARLLEEIDRILKGSGWTVGE